MTIYAADRALESARELKVWIDRHASRGSGFGDRVREVERALETLRRDLRLGVEKGDVRLLHGPVRNGNG